MRGPTGAVAPRDNEETGGGKGGGRYRTRAGAGGGGRYINRGAAMAAGVTGSGRALQATVTGTGSGRRPRWRPLHKRRLELEVEAPVL
jgi:hypothetical protein